ncbi:hypothetical protein GSI_11679 [Ganoderma sinense ZZ0214-1]|uniref:RanBP2-type domain-containing protein n=1 Tax=Ganoderma sinense ZZ0214-1 TaxID=1077348 RepID=A0A2G8RWN1_9APHY|nr:hypothetical protein GSI_11679 [Ganoderma sinense ZZ0214-1]
MPPHHPHHQPTGTVADHHAHNRRESAPSRPLPPPHRALLSLPASPSQATREILPQTPLAVVRLSNLRSTPNDLLWNLFSHGCSQLDLQTPTPVFPHSDPDDSTLWAIFSSSSDARAAQSLSCDIFSVSPAETDLAFLSAARRPPSNPPALDLPHPSTRMLSTPHSAEIRLSRPSHPASRNAFHDSGGDSLSSYTISSNPPNPKTSFRLGDWMCSAPNCSAHNFQRNTVCIACGRPRTGSTPALPGDPSLSPTFPLAGPSPRFAGRFITSQGNSTVASGPTGPPAPGYPSHPAASALAAAHAQMSSKPPPPQYPPLTPSGRALSVGGRVRNISRDPLSPCVMYWPDNEPLPEPCQIRPIDSALMTYPPIINTGNKGAAEKQPGDWLCGKCNYHNWRRRKVCQTCFPYAEGNGDSISAAVQAERIALLANVLVTQFNALDLDGVPSEPGQSPSGAPPQQARFPDGRSLSLGNSRPVSPSPLLPPLPLGDPVTSPIYQTSGAPKQVIGSERALRTAPPHGTIFMPSPADSHNLLPSFLQEIVHSPSQSSSPASSSSADLSYDGSSEDAHYVLTPGTSSASFLPSPYRRGLSSPEVRKGSSSSFSSLGRGSVSSIWKLDGEESKTYSSSSSTRTSPTAHHAQAAPVRRNGHANSNNSAAAVGFVDGESGITPKGTASLWQAQARYA